MERSADHLSNHVYLTAMSGTSCLEEVSGLITATGSACGSGTGFTAGGDLSGTSSSQTVIGINNVPLCTGFTPTNGQLLQYTTGGSPNPCYTAATAGIGGDTISSPNGTLTVGGTVTATTLDLKGSAGEIMAGSTPALTYTPQLGVDNSHAGTLALSNGSASAHTVFGSAATTTNTILGPATVPTTLDLLYCAVSSTTCTLTDTGYAYNAIPNADLAHSAITIAGTSVSLGGSTSSLPSPGAIGGTTPAAITGTTITANTSLTDAAVVSANGLATSGAGLLQAQTASNIGALIDQGTDNILYSAGTGSAVASITAPTTVSTFQVPSWQPTGSAVAPTAVNIGTTFFTTTFVDATANAFVQNKMVYGSFNLPNAVYCQNLYWNIYTADNTSNLYGLAIYSISGTTATKTGCAVDALAGTSFAPSTAAVRSCSNFGCAVASGNLLDRLHNELLNELRSPQGADIWFSRHDLFQYIRHRIAIGWNDSHHYHCVSISSERSYTRIHDLLTIELGGGCTVQNASSSSITVKGTSTDAINYMCVGN